MKPLTWESMSDEDKRKWLRNKESALRLKLTETAGTDEYIVARIQLDALRTIKEEARL